MSRPPRQTNGPLRTGVFSSSSLVRVHLGVIREPQRERTGKIRGSENVVKRVWETIQRVLREVLNAGLTGLCPASNRPFMLFSIDCCKTLQWPRIVLEIKSKPPTQAHRAPASSGMTGLPLSQPALPTPFGCSKRFLPMILCTCSPQSDTFLGFR